MSRIAPHRRRRSGGEEAGHAGGMERWLLTYSDMITLLLALFVILFAVASVNKTKLEQVSQSVRHSLSSGGIAAGAAPHHPAHAASPTTTSATTAPSTPATPSPSSLAALEAQVRHALAVAHLLGDVDMQLHPRGLVIRLLADKLFFATNSAALTSVGDRVVDVTGRVLARHANAVVVEGYTDDVPVTGGPYYSNWALSAIRAVTVVLRLTRVDGVKRDQLVAEGFGASHPLVPNDSPAQRAENRRVNIVVLATRQVRA